MDYEPSSSRGARARRGVPRSRGRRGRGGARPPRESTGRGGGRGQGRGRGSLLADLSQEDFTRVKKLHEERIAFEEVCVRSNTTLKCCQSHRTKITNYISSTTTIVIVMCAQSKVSRDFPLNEATLTTFGSCYSNVYFYICEVDCVL